MSGNIWEWVWDKYGTYSSSSLTDPTGATSGSYRVSRGGSWSNLARLTRVSFRRRYASSDRLNVPQCGEVMMLRAVSVLPPLAMTLLDAMNWRGPPMWVGFTDA